MKRIWLEVVGALLITALVCFGTGVYIGSSGSPAYATTKEISVNVVIETKSGDVLEKTVGIRDGMSAFDALLKIADVETQYWESLDSSIVVSIAGDELGANEGYIYTVNGEAPSVGMADCQLHDGDNLHIRYTSW